MRSVRGGAAAQECLPLELPPPVPPPAPRERPAQVKADGEDMRIRLRNDALASRGWPAGTELVVSTDRRPRRGEVALVREGGRLRIGVLEVQFGRSALRTDHGATLVGSAARMVGVVTVAAAPLEGMPLVSPPPAGRG
ncbi:hypothetical protein [Nocardioides daeguensis]|uniref:Uncharacterized protein n=1 Tax=Nocardioides daeguensis TaxID=908359 RepID=A0ABP6UUL7_9ACTN|nr:hypothetical protein [Nocardioides daeguensis]MBV6728311.1 hypothetical protein [Nocardioides daeguensis]MCR1773120.1 hypothetical protein [Nocardioides daeguensis]